MYSAETQALMDAAVDAIILIDHTGRIDAVNRAAERLFGYSEAELVGENVNILMPEPYRSAHNDYLARYAATGVAHIIGVGREVQAQRHDGTVFPAFVSVGRIEGSDPPRYVGLVRDVTPQKQAMAALMAERDRANSYLELNDAVLVTLDPDRRIQLINRRGCELLGLTEEEVLGRDWLDFAADDSSRAQAEALLTRATAQPGEAQSSDLNIVDGRGETRILAWRCIGLRGHNGNSQGVMCAGVDITERNRRAEESRRAQERLTHVARLATMGEMAAGIAHELNQPLTAVSNYARACERFLQMPEPDFEEIREAVREISSEALRAGEIIRRLRRLVRAETTERSVVNINDVLDELKVLSQADARVHRTQITYELAENLPRVYVDPIQIQQVVLNLLRNALEALTEIPEGARHVTVRTAAVDDGIEISISDNGPGVPEEIVGRMFDPFCTTKKSGTGLGLSISRTVVQAQSGSIGYRPCQPRGACFYIRLPSAEED